MRLFSELLCLNRSNRGQWSARFIQCLDHEKNTMATTSPVSDVTEDCDRCERSTPHEVAVEILTESRKTENAEFSREPYRVSECRVCGATTKRRMNNA